MLHKLASLAQHQYHNAPLWAFAALGALLIFEYLLGKYHPKSKSTIALAGAALKLGALGVAFVLRKFPPTALVGEFLKSILVPLLVLGMCLSQSGCLSTALKGQSIQNDVKILTADMKQIAHDCKEKCGPDVAALGPLVMQALTVATSNANALGLIMAGVAMLPAAVQAGEGVWCVIETVRADLKAMNVPQAVAIADDLLAQHRYEVMRAEATRSAL